MDPGRHQVLRKALFSCLCASLIFGLVCIVEKIGFSRNVTFNNSMIIYKKPSKLIEQIVTISDPDTKNLDEFTIITRFHYDYRPNKNYYSTIIDSCNSRFRLMMHEYSPMRAYCNSGLLWPKTVNNFQVNKALPPNNYHVVFTYDNGKTASYIDGSLNWTQHVSDKSIDLSKFSLLMNCPANEGKHFGGQFVGEVAAITILKRALTPHEVAEVFKAAIKSSADIGTVFVIEYLLPWTLILFVCWYFTNIFNFLVRCFKENKLLEKYILFVYIVTGIFFIVYNIGETILKDIEASSSDEFIASYIFWLLYACFITLYWTVLYKIFRRPLLPVLSCLYFITALLVYSLWLYSMNALIPFIGNLFMAVCVATFVVNPLLFMRD